MNIKKIYLTLLISGAMLWGCKQDNPDGYDVGAGAGNTETYDDRGAGNSGGTADHPGQNIGSTTDSTSIDADDPNPSNY